MTSHVHRSPRRALRRRRSGHPALGRRQRRSGDVSGAPRHGGQRVRDRVARRAGRPPGRAPSRDPLRPSRHRPFDPGLHRPAVSDHRPGARRHRRARRLRRRPRPRRRHVAGRHSRAAPAARRARTAALGDAVLHRRARARPARAGPARPRPGDPGHVGAPRRTARSRSGGGVQRRTLAAVVGRAHAAGRSRRTSSARSRSGSAITPATTSPASPTPRPIRRISPAEPSSPACARRRWSSRRRSIPSTHRPTRSTWRG